MEMEPLTSYQVISLVVGGGALFTLLRFSFLLGQYSQRVNVVETNLDEIKDRMSELTHEVNALRRERPHVATSH
jgi:hypothetical protein